jgi:hypothetical protein
MDQVTLWQHCMYVSNAALEFCIQIQEVMNIIFALKYNVIQF